MLSRLLDHAVNAMSPRLLAYLVTKLPRSFFDWKRRAAFKEVVRYAYRASPFYKRRFDELGIDVTKITCPADLGTFYTTPRDVIDHAEEFICRPPHIVFESSGTTGRNKRVYLTYDELDTVGILHAFGFFLWGLDRNDRMVNAFDFCIWIPGMVTQKGFEKARIFGMAAGKVDPSEVYKRIPVHNFNVVMGEPTWLIKLTELAEKNGAYPLKLIVGAAEAMPAAARPWMEKVWGGATIRMAYASVESGGVLGAELSGQCGAYHVDENDFYIEIADPAADGYGEVTFTTLRRRTMPLIRYRNRDISKLIDEPCPCGIPYRRLAPMRGRADEMVIASGGNLYPLLFEDILKDVAGITSDWKIVFRLRGIKEVMEFNLELRPGASADAVRDEVFAHMKDRYPDLWKNYAIAIFEIAFVYHAPGAVRVGHKLIRLVDERYAKA